MVESDHPSRFHFEDGYVGGSDDKGDVKGIRLKIFRNLTLMDNDP